MAPKLLVVGGGKMGSALLTGVIAAGWAPLADLVVSDPDPAQRPRLSEAHPGLQVVEGPVAADGALLAVKPDAAEGVLRTLAAVGIARVLSIVAGLVDGPARGRVRTGTGGGAFHAQHAFAGRKRRGRHLRAAARPSLPISTGPRESSGRWAPWFGFPNATSMP